MGCSTSQGAKVVSEVKENGINETTEGDRKYPPAEAFEVPLEEDSDSIIKKHPPKRLQRLVDAPIIQTTIEELEEKLANAEVRRNQFLMERVNTLKAKDDETIAKNEQEGDEIDNNATQETPIDDDANELHAPHDDVDVSKESGNDNENGHGP
ncbi:hypothetical protein Bhyg_00869 [Pseudolycoriella hygida]|uniref:Uncharacterized protein n=1 Tax=Pseudolycoriella hygida TaxID=35572 RepID=A0A9Q0N8D4_9DIPT|nr:hypothetical protein Bhyg_00869 [Pseudolycoriella hygida]